MMNNQQSSSITSKYDESHDYFNPQVHLNPLITKINNQNIIKGILLILTIIIIIINNLQISKIKSHFQQLETTHFQLSKNVKTNHDLILGQQRERTRVFDEMLTDSKKQFVEIKGDLQKFVEKLITELHYSKKMIYKIQNQLSSINPNFNLTNQHPTISLSIIKQTNPTNLPQKTKQTHPINQAQNKNEAKQTAQSQKSILKDLNILQTTLSFLFQQSITQYHYNKVKYLKSITHKANVTKWSQSIISSFDNIQLKHSDIILSKQIKQNDLANHERLSKQYQFDKYKLQLPFCLIVPTYNNAKNYRYLYNIQSIVNLNYTNYKVIIIDDNSHDSTYQLLQQHLTQNPQLHNIHLIKNEKHMTAVPSIDRGIRQYCNKQDIVVLIDGDDQLLIKDSLKVFNSVYQKLGVDVAYSNHIQLYWHKNYLKNGWSMAYTKEQIKNNRYRQVPQKISHLRTFKVSLYLQIKPEDLKDENGEWYTSTYDQVICLPILEMSCGRIAYVEEYFYLYNFGIGTNDLMVNKTLQKNIANTIKFQRKKYKCLDKIK